MTQRHFAKQNVVTIGLSKLRQGGNREAIDGFLMTKRHFAKQNVVTIGLNNPTPRVGLEPTTARLTAACSTD